MDLRNLITLKEMLQTEDDFGNTLNYFFDLMEHDEIMDGGKRIKDDTFLKQMIKEIGRRLLGKTVIPVNFLLIGVPEYRFYHGGFMIEGRMGNIFYFRDIDMGMMALTSPGLKPPTHIMRFSITRIDGHSPFFTQHINRSWH